MPLRLSASSSAEATSAILHETWPIVRSGGPRAPAGQDAKILAGTIKTAAWIARNLSLGMRPKGGTFVTRNNVARGATWMFAFCGVLISPVIVVFGPLLVIGVGADLMQAFIG